MVSVLDAMAPCSLSLRILNKPEEFEKVYAWLEEAAMRLGLDDRVHFKLDLILNEALTNTMSYGYTDQASHGIDISLTNETGRIVLEIVDDGIAFNPFAAGPYQASENLADATAEGRGVHLMKSMTDAQDYSRLNDKNVIRLAINLAGNPQPAGAQ